MAWDAYTHTVLKNCDKDLVNLRVQISKRGYRNRKSTQKKYFVAKYVHLPALKFGKEGTLDLKA